MITRVASGGRMGVDVLDVYMFDAARFRLNKIKAPDIAPWLHNHPYEFCWSLILNGGYTHEFAVIQADGTLGPREMKTFRSGDVNFMPHSTFHRIDSVEPETYTQIFFGPDKGGRVIKYWTPEGLKTHKQLEEWLDAKQV